MKFKQISTGTVLDTSDETVIAMMAASDAYIEVKSEKGSKTEKSQKSEK